MPKRKLKPKAKRKVVVVPVEHLTLIEEVHKASTDAYRTSTKAYRRFKKWLKK